MFYDENLYYLDEVINNVGMGSKLDISADLFLDKTVEDVFFVENALSIIYGSLREAERLIQRAEHLRKILRTKTRFAEVLDSITNGEHALSSQLEPFFARFREMAQNQRSHRSEILKLISESTVDSDQTTDVVSEKELSFLLMDGGADEHST